LLDYFSCCVLLRKHVLAGNLFSARVEAQPFLVRDRSAAFRPRWADAAWWTVPLTAGPGPPH